MDKEIKARWVEALRSGKYEQGDGYLCINNKYCCLGVLLEEDNLLEPESNGSSIKAIIGTNGHKTGSLTVELVTQYGLDVEVPNPTNDAHKSIALGACILLNDDLKKSFDEIADWIEKNL